MDMLEKLYAAKAVVRAADEAREPIDVLRERAENRRVEVVNLAPQAQAQR